MTSPRIKYPFSRRCETTDNYFGTEVADPYRWLEESRSDETRQWISAQNRLSKSYLSAIPYRPAIRQRLTELWHSPQFGIPERHGDRLFFFHNDSGHNQSILYCQPDGEEARIFLDPNTLSPDGTAALTGISFSKNGKYMAYSLAVSGSDWSEIRIMECATGRLLADRIHWVKFSCAVWCGEGFYYSGFDAPDTGKEYEAQSLAQKIFYHRLGSEQSDDQTIYHDPKHPQRYFQASVSRDEQHLFVIASEGTSGSEVLYRRIEDETKFQLLFSGFDYDYTFVCADRDEALFLTNEQAPNGKVVRATLQDNPQIEPWLPESDNRLIQVTSAGGAYFAHYLKDACSEIIRLDNAGNRTSQVDLPGNGTVSGFDNDGNDDIFYSYTSFIDPVSIYRYDLRSGKSSLYRSPEKQFDPASFVVERHRAQSKDGTSIPFFVVRNRNSQPDGDRPTYLYGYGGFDISLTPTFSPLAIAWMEQGGLYVVANLRGGGEFGEQWHRAGMKARKQNVFDDFIAVAQQLIDSGYTSPRKLAIAGGSNGGLLVGACMTQRPDLFAVALPAVGVMDMLRYQYFTVGWGWCVEYGNSELPEEFAWLYAYSPLHNIRPGGDYPATLITTADHDDRVVPAHSFKFAATLQAAQKGDRPILIRIDSAAGHGMGKPLSKKIEEQTDQLAFLFENTATPYHPIHDAPSTV